jgi:hypothetical protein
MQNSPYDTVEKITQVKYIRWSHPDCSPTHEQAERLLDCCAIRTRDFYFASLCSN